MFGIEPDKVSPGFILTTTHPDDQGRHHLIRAKLISIAQELYIQKGGTRIISTNVRAKNPEGRVVNLLYQCFLFYSKIPYESTFLILVITDISDFEKIHKGFHFYLGEDRRYFRFNSWQCKVCETTISHGPIRSTSPTRMQPANQPSRSPDASAPAAYPFAISK